MREIVGPVLHLLLTVMLGYVETPIFSYKVSAAIKATYSEECSFEMSTDSSYGIGFFILWSQFVHDYNWLNLGSVSEASHFESLNHIWLNHCFLRAVAFVINWAAQKKTGFRKVIGVHEFWEATKGFWLSSLYCSWRAAGFQKLRILQQFPLIHRQCVPDSQWVPETADSTKSNILSI